MKKDELKYSLDAIQPDAYMKTRLAAKLTETRPKRSRKKKTAAVVSGVLCAAIVVTAIAFGYSNPPLTQNDIPSSVGKEAGGIMIVNAKEGNAKSRDLRAVSTDLEYHIKVIDIRSQSEEEIEKYFENRSNEMLENGMKEEDYYEYHHSAERLENVIVDIDAYDMFCLDIPHPDSVKKITVSNTCQYAVPEFTVGETEYDEESQTLTLPWRRAHQLSISGEEYESAIKKEAFSLRWVLEQPFYDAVDENPAFNLSQIQDDMTITVQFENGDAATSVVEIAFHQDGTMNAKLKSFHFVEK